MIVSRGNDFPFMPENTDGIVEGSVQEVPLSLTWYGDTLQVNGEALGTDPFSNAIRTIVTDISIPNDTQVIAVITFGELMRNSARVIVRVEASIEIRYTNIVENQTGRVLEQPTLSYLGENNEVITVRGLEVAAGTNSSLLLLDPTREDIAQWLNDMGIPIDSEFVAVQVVTTPIGENVLIAVFEDSESAVILERNTFNATSINARRNPSASSELVFSITSNMSTVAVSPLSFEAQSELERLAEDNTDIAFTYDYENGLVQTVSANGILFTYVRITQINGDISYVWVATNSGASTGYATYISFEDPFSPTRNLTPENPIEGQPTPPAPRTQSVDTPNTNQNLQVVAVPAPTAPRTEGVEVSTPPPTGTEVANNNDDWFNTPLGDTDILPTAVPEGKWIATAVGYSTEHFDFSGVQVTPLQTTSFEIPNGREEFITIHNWFVIGWLDVNNKEQIAIIPAAISFPYIWSYYNELQTEMLYFSGIYEGFFTNTFRPEAISNVVLMRLYGFTEEQISSLQLGQYLDVSGTPFRITVGTFTTPDFNTMLTDSFGEYGLNIGQINEFRRTGDLAPILGMLPTHNGIPILPVRQFASVNN